MVASTACDEDGSFDAAAASMGILPDATKQVVPKRCRRNSCANVPGKHMWAKYADGGKKKEDRAPVGDSCANCALTWAECGYWTKGEISDVLEQCNSNKELDQDFVLADRRRMG